MRHEWRLLGAAAGWEVYSCKRCGCTYIPTPFGALWPDVLYRLSFGRLGRCPARECARVQMPTDHYCHECGSRLRA